MVVWIESLIFNLENMKGIYKWKPLEELYEAIEDEKPDDVYHYVKDFLIKNYPYHGDYAKNI